MDYTSISELARSQTNTSEGQVTAANLLKYANISYKRIQNAITEGISDDYFYQYFNTDTVADQNEYTLPVSSATVQGYKRLLSVEVKRGTDDTQYTLLESSRNTEYGVGLEYLGDNQPQSSGIYDIKDSAIFIYPTPTSSVTDGIKIQAIISLIDLVGTETEAEIFPGHSELRDYYYLIAKGMEEFIFREKQEAEKSQLAKQNFNNELLTMVRSLKRYQGNTVGKLPNLDYYKY